MLRKIMQKITRSLFFSLCTLTALHTNTNNVSDTEKINRFKYYAAIRAIPGFGTYVLNGTNPLHYHMLINDLTKIVTNGGKSVPLVSYNVIPLITSRDVAVIGTSLMSSYFKEKPIDPTILLARFVQDKAYEVTAYYTKKGIDIGYSRLEKTTIGKQLEKVIANTKLWIAKNPIVCQETVNTMVSTDFIHDTINNIKNAAPRAVFDFLLNEVIRIMYIKNIQENKP